MAPGAAMATGGMGWARRSLGGSLSGSELLSMGALGLGQGAVGNALASVDHPQVGAGRSPREGAGSGVLGEGSVRERGNCEKRDWGSVGVAALRLRACLADVPGALLRVVNWTRALL